MIGKTNFVGPLAAAMTLGLLACFGQPERDHAPAAPKNAPPQNEPDNDPPDEEPPAAQPPALTVTSPANGATIVLSETRRVAVAFTVERFELRAQGTCAGRAGCGHVRLSIDGASCNAPGRAYNASSATSPIEADFTYCPDVAGAHAIAVTLHADDGAAVVHSAEPVAARVQVTTETTPQYPTGNPEIASIYEIAFGPDGWLLIGDGYNSQLVAVQTNDRDASAAPANRFALVANIDQKIADALGAPSRADVEIEDIAINPISKAVYAAVARRDVGTHVLVRMDGRGSIYAVDLTHVTYARMRFAEEGGSFLWDVAWTDNWIIAAGSLQPGFASRVVTVPLPLRHDATASASKMETYHTTGDMWLTEAPIDRFTPYVENGALHIVGGLTCTPVVRFTVADLAVSGANVIGQSPLGMDFGKWIEDLFFYEKDGQSYLLATVQGLGDDFSLGMARFKRSLIVKPDQLNEEAPDVFTCGSCNTSPFRWTSAHADAERMTALDGAARMAKLDDANGVFLWDRGTGFDLETRALP